MSSTVTTATVSSVTAAITMEGVAQVFTLIALVLLGVVLLAKEITSGSTQPRVRALARGLDIGILPLIVVFVVMLAVNTLTIGLGG